MTEPEWLACDEPLELLEAVRDVPPYTRLWQYVVFCLRDFGAGQAAELVEQQVSGSVDERAVQEFRQRLLVQAQRVSGGGYSPGRKSVHLSLATQRARAAVAALQSDARSAAVAVTRETRHLLRRDQCCWLRCLFANTRPAAADPSWLTSTVLAVASHVHDSRDFTAMPILADALQEAGCDNDDILNHCRQTGVHVRGCWVVETVLGER